MVVTPSKILRLSYYILPFLTFAFSVITMSMSAALVDHYQSPGNTCPPPQDKCRDRIRMVLSAAIVSLFFTIYLAVGVASQAASRAFGMVVVVFMNFIGVATITGGVTALTTLTVNYDCNNFKWGKCDILKASVASAWVLTALMIIMLFWDAYAAVVGGRDRSFTSAIAQILAGKGVSDGFSNVDDA